MRLLHFWNKYPQILLKFFPLTSMCDDQWQGEQKPLQLFMLRDRVNLKASYRSKNA